MLGTVASDSRMHSASSCCIMLREHGLISTTLDAVAVYLLVKVKGTLIGWPMHVYPLLGFTINTSYALVLLGHELNKSALLAALFLHSRRSLPQNLME